MTESANVKETEKGSQLYLDQDNSSLRKHLGGRSYDKSELVFVGLGIWMEESQNNKITNGEQEKALHEVEIRLDKLFSIKKPAGLPATPHCLC